MCGLPRQVIQERPGGVTPCWHAKPRYRSDAAARCRDPLVRGAGRELDGGPGAGPAAARFLDKLLRETPFPVKAIRIDGGSEFMGAFEAACAARAIPLWVLPPARPR